MKTILSFVLIVVMGMTYQKENQMSYGDQIRERQMARNADYQARTEAGRQGQAADVMRGRGMNRAEESAGATLGGGAWKNAYANRWGAGATGGDGSNIPYNPFTKAMQQQADNSLQSQMAAANKPTDWQGAYANRWGNGAVGGPGTPYNPFAKAMQQQADNSLQSQMANAGAPSKFSLPAWLNTATASRQNQTMGPQLANPNAYEVGADGNIRNKNRDGGSGAGSFIAGGGAAVRNSTPVASWLNLPQYPTGTFFAGGGDQVAGPVTMPGVTEGGGGGGEMGYGGGGWGGGGGGFGWGGRRSAWSPDMGLFSWNYKG